MYIKNTQRITYLDFKKAIEDLKSKKTLIIFGNIYNKSSTDFIYDPNSGSDYNEQDLRRAAYQISSVSDYRNNTTILSFKSYSVGTPINNKIALGFLMEEVCASLERKMKNYGIYKIEHGHIISKKTGAVWFGMLSVDTLSNIEDIFFSCIQEVKEDINLKNKFKIFKKQMIQDLKIQWKASFEKNEWISDDLNDFSRIVSLKEMICAIKSITAENIVQIAEEVFDKNKLQILKSY
jgi:predicted Zn-dependent peptidase